LLKIPKLELVPCMLAQKTGVVLMAQVLGNFPEKDWVDKVRGFKKSWWT
jgi:hypothetical protein